MEEGIKSGLKQRDVTTREVTTVAKPEARVEETSTSDFERSNMLVQIVSKVWTAYESFFQSVVLRAFLNTKCFSTAIVWSNYPQSERWRL